MPVVLMYSDHHRFWVYPNWFVICRKTAAGLAAGPLGAVRLLSGNGGCGQILSKWRLKMNRRFDPASA